MLKHAELLSQTSWHLCGWHITGRCMPVIGCCYLLHYPMERHPGTTLTHHIQYTWVLLYAYSYCFAMSIYNAYSVIFVCDGLFFCGG